MQGKQRERETAIKWESCWWRGGGGGEQARERKEGGGGERGGGHRGSLHSALDCICQLKIEFLCFARHCANLVGKLSATDSAFATPEAKI